MKKSAKAVMAGVVTALYSLNVLYLVTFLLSEGISFVSNIIDKLGPIGDLFDTRYEFPYMYAAVAMIFSLIFIVILAFIFKRKSIAVAGVNIAAAIGSTIVFHSFNDIHDLFSCEIHKSNKEIKTEKHNLKQAF